MTRIFFIALAIAAAPLTAAAAPCPGNADALGTERVIEVDAKSTPRVGRKQFPATLPLRAKELVLTFDDGPWPGLREGVGCSKGERVRATSFPPGRIRRRIPNLRGAPSGKPQCGSPQLSTSPPQRHVDRQAEAEIDRYRCG